MRLNLQNKNILYYSKDKKIWIKIDISDNIFFGLEEKTDIYNFKIDNYSFTFNSIGKSYELLINSFSFNDLKLKKENKNNIINDNYIKVNKCIFKTPKASRNIQSRLNHQSSGELLIKAINNERKIHRNMQVNYYTNDNFKSQLPDFASNLPKSIYQVYQYKNANMIKHCLICLEKYIIGQEICTLPCFHFFHCNCISEWLKYEKNCPICRVSIELK